MKQQFLNTLLRLTGKVPNKQLLVNLQLENMVWDLTTYNQIKQELIQEGLVKSYRCRGGGVMMTNNVATY